MLNQSISVIFKVTLFHLWQTNFPLIRGVDQQSHTGACFIDTIVISCSWLRVSVCQRHDGSASLMCFYCLLMMRNPADFVKHVQVC